MSEGNGRFDLDAKREARRAAQDEAAQRRWTFHFGGREFSLAPQGELPANVKQLFEEGDFAEVLAVLIDDAAAFWAIRPRPSINDIKDLFDAYGEWAGVGDLGESSASLLPVSIPT